MIKTTPTETIIAIATATSEAGIGIVRLSGPLALSCADRCITDQKHARTLAERKPNTIQFGYVTDAEGNDVDEALISYMKAPHSYTGEDVVEINVHGGRFILEKVLKTLLAENKGRLRLALPGEFTKRAFLNGKMDLSQAEAVQDMIAAESDFALTNAMRQLRGDLRKLVTDMREQILHETAFLEAALDDPENYNLDAYTDKLEPVLDELVCTLQNLMNTAEEGRIIKEGIRAAIIGKPNVGKSTLLNLLSGTDKAIVTDIPGTTRDVLSENIRIGDLVLLVSDTAGLHETDDPVEKIGVERALQYAKEADLILAVLDLKDIICEFSKTEPAMDTKQEDMDLLSFVFEPEVLRCMRQKKCVIFLNKEDLITDEQKTYAKKALEKSLLKQGLSSNIKTITTSFLSSSLYQDETVRFKQALYDLFLRDEFVNRGEYVLTNERHIQALLKAKESLILAKKTIRDGAGEDLLTVDLMDAYTALSSIIGENVEDDLADRIFSKFCMGK